MDNLIILNFKMVHCYLADSTTFKYTGPKAALVFNVSISPILVSKVHSKNIRDDSSGEIIAEVQESGETTDANSDVQHGCLVGGVSGISSMWRNYNNSKG